MYSKATGAQRTGDNNKNQHLLSFYHMPSTVLRNTKRIWEDCSEQGGRKTPDREGLYKPHRRFYPEDSGMGGRTL